MPCDIGKTVHDPTHHQKDPQQIENAIFQKARTRQDYLNCIARFILMIKSQRNSAAQQGTNCYSIFTQHMHKMVQEVGRVGLTVDTSDA